MAESLSIHAYAMSKNDHVMTRSILLSDASEVTDLNIIIEISFYSVFEEYLYAVYLLSIDQTQININGPIIFEFCYN